jgi:hypothetical protein
MAREGDDCTFCGHALSAGQPAVLDSFFVLNLEAEVEDTTEIGSGLAGLWNVSMPKTASFRDLSWFTKQKLMAAGLGKGRGLRSYAAAEQFYHSSIPAQVRNQGESAVLGFLRGKHASHIESVANAPGKAKMSGNMVWESAKANARRGSRNMSRVERLRANVVNGTHSAALVARTAAANAGRGAAFAALLEAPVSALENAIHVVKGRQSRERGAKEAAKDVGKAGVAGAVVAGTVTVAAAAGAGPAVAAASPVLVPVGLGLYGYSSVRRVHRAMTEEILASVQLRFHAQCAECGDGQLGASCYAKFASDVSCDENYDRRLEHLQGK